MSAHAHDEPDESPDGSLDAHEQRAWDAIVADLSGQVDLGPMFPSQPPAPAPDERPHPDDVWLDEGYEPPAPPPLPRPRDPVAKAAWAGVLGGPLLFLLVWALGWQRWIGLLAAAATIGGFAALIARMPAEREDDDGGAVV